MARKGPERVSCLLLVEDCGFDVKTPVLKMSVPNKKLIGSISLSKLVQQRNVVTPKA